MPAPPPFCSSARALLTFLLYFPFIYLDLIASNYAVVRWNLLPEAQKRPLPDVVHDNFAFYENHTYLKEWPLVILYVIVIFGFILPHDVLSHPRKNYRRHTSLIHFFETRIVLEFIRSCTVFLTSTSDPLGLSCVDVESSTIENIYTHWTFARCGDNIYSGHVGQLLSLVFFIQTYIIQGNSLLKTILLWTTAILLSFYVIVSRLHYTVDVVLAWFLVSSVWVAWYTVSGSGPEIKSKDS
ncbi:hypothetical protein TrST_g10788 [Triparma strigata]|uniref:Sphingomyelin synthase-like domain-containing protein n=1 Tax=Triparma strigata TaxID=1606541 RepID=A0A9W7BZ65_9STRA|nr:hypothetical protein TrST_g10788 [Triparma strigata]